MEVMLVLHMNGSTETTSLMKLVPLIKLMDMIMELDALIKLNAETAYLLKDAGHNKEPKFMESKNLEMSRDRKI